jgi:hypothetical protein
MIYGSAQSFSQHSTRLVRLLLHRTIKVEVFTSLQRRENEVVFSEKIVEPG